MTRAKKLLKRLGMNIVKDGSNPQELEFRDETGEIVPSATVLGLLNASEGALAPLASPALTGNPTAPTQAAGNATTRLATTAFVNNNFGQLWATPVASTTLTGTLAAWTVTAVDCTAGAGARSLPAANSVVAGTAFVAKKGDTSANALVVSRSGSDLIFGTGSGATTKTLTLAGEAVEFVSNGVDKYTVRASDTPSAVLNVLYGPGIIPATGIAATDTAAIQAAHDALPANGGDIRLAGGTYVVTGGGLTFSKRVRLRGVGAGTRTGVSAGVAITIIQCASATANAITVTSAGCSFEDFDLANTSGSTPTAGAGIAITTNGVRTRYRNISVHGFYRNVDVQVGAEWSMTDCLLYDFVKTGLRIANADVPDGGDMGVINNQFVAGPTNTTAQAGVEWVSGGGLRFIGNKINSQVFGQLTIGLFLHPADGISTSVFTITGNSFEGSNYGIYSDDTGNSGTGIIGKITITGNEFLIGSGKTIALNRASSGKLSNVVISSNVHTSTITTGGISLTNLADAILTGNTFGSNITDAGRLSIGTGVTLITLSGDFAFATAGRPVATTMRNGSRYWDTTLNKPVWSTGSSWVLADGTAA